MKHLFLLGLLVYSLSCDNPDYYLIKNSDKKVLPEPLSNNLNQIFCCQNLIELEHTDPLIGTIDELKVTNKYITLSDGKYPSIFLFDRKGFYLNLLDKIGQGPGEYLAIDDFDIDGDSLLYLLDGRLKTIHQYSLPEFNYIESYRLPFFARKFTVTPYGFLFYKAAQSSNKEDTSYFYNLINMDKNLQVISKFDPYKLKAGQNNFSLFTPNTLNSVGSVSYYHKFASDTVYKIDTSGKIDFHLSINFNRDKANLSLSDFSSPREYLNETMTTEDKIVGISSFFQLFDQSFITWMYKQKPYLAYYNNQTGLIKVFENNWFYLDGFGEIPVFPKYSGEDAIISVLDYFKPDFVTSSSIDSLLIKRVREVDAGLRNPMLIFHKIKEL